MSDIISFEDDSGENDLLAFTASAESKSEHPLGKAIVAYAKKKEVSIPEPDNFKMESGKGICAEVLGKQFYCGNEKFFAENSIEINANIKTRLEQLRMQGKASVLVADGAKCVGIIALSDVLRPEAEKMVTKLHEMKTGVV